MIPRGLPSCNPSPEVCTILPGSVSSGVSSRLISCVCVFLWLTMFLFSHGMIERSRPYLWPACSNYTECHARLVQPFSIFPYHVFILSSSLIHHLCHYKLTWILLEKRNAKHLKSTYYINQLKALVIQQDLYRSRQLSYLNLALFLDTLYKNILFAVIPREPNITHGQQNLYTFLK